LVWYGKSFHESEMALLGVQFSKCARVGLDSADIVRDAIYQQLNLRGTIQKNSGNV
jgi:hypothetical protein